MPNPNGGPRPPGAPSSPVTPDQAAPRHPYRDILEILHAEPEETTTSSEAPPEVQAELKVQAPPEVQAELNAIAEREQSLLPAILLDTGLRGPKHQPSLAIWSREGRGNLAALVHRRWHKVSERVALSPRARPAQLVGAVVLTLVVAAIAVLSLQDREPEPAYPPIAAASESPSTPTGGTAPDRLLGRSQASYAAVVDAVAVADSLDDLSAAGKSASAKLAGFEKLTHTSAKSSSRDARPIRDLLRSQLGSLRVISRLANVKTEPMAGLGPLSTRLPATTAAVKSAARTIRKSDAQVDPVVPSDASRNALSVIGDTVSTSLTDRVGAFVAAMSAADLTADLRSVGQRAEEQRTAVANAMQSFGDGARPPAYLREAGTAFERLSALRAIDAGNLGAWSGIAPPLRRALLATPSDPARSTAAIGNVDSLVSAAKVTIASYQASVAQATADSPPLQALQSYAAAVRPLFNRYRGSYSQVPRVGAAQQPSFALITRFYNSISPPSSTAVAVRSVGAVPASMSAAHGALVNLADSARTMAAAGHDVAVAAERCDTRSGRCLFGQQPGWGSYSAASSRASAVTSVEQNWEAALARAEAAADHTSVPPQPVV